MRRTILMAILALFLIIPQTSAKKRKRMTMAEKVDLVLKTIQPLKHERGERFPLFFWHLRGTRTDEGDELVETLKALNDRGLPVVPSWTTHPKTKENEMARCVRIAKAQNKLGIPAYIFAGNTGSGFYRDESTWHVDEKGNRFPDTSHVERIKLGCPFEKSGWPAVAEQIREWVKYYKKNGARLDGVWFDWEATGPSEWNDSWNLCRKCVRCRKELGEAGLKDFGVFQERIRKIRSAMQKLFVDVIHEEFPKANVANYGVYPQGPYRYWWDWYEKMVPGAPAKKDQRAVYRKWYNEFPLTGFTIGMPVVYGWDRIFVEYDYEDIDFRWFRNMLMVFSDSAAHRPEGVPLVSWVNRFVDLAGPPENAVPLSEEKFKELLWHMLLRGADGFYIWCREEDMLRELVPVHAVYAASLQYKDFLSNGKPVTFDVPDEEGPVISALQMGKKLLLRRTDFGKAAPAEVSIEVAGAKIPVPASASGKTIILDIP